MSDTPSLRVIFSATPYAMGSMIRLVTHHAYNHVSVALGTAPGATCTFARRYENVPFCGGFVEESPLRFRRGNRIARVKVCVLPLTAAQAETVARRFAQMRATPEHYLYNLLSAAAAPLHRKIPIRDAYTCAEFAASVLADCGVTERDERRFYDLPALEALLADYVRYEGPARLDEDANWCGDTFLRRQSPLRGAAMTAQLSARLLRRLAADRTRKGGERR